MAFFVRSLTNLVARSFSQQSPAVRSFTSLIASSFRRPSTLSLTKSDCNMIVTREMNRNARRPKPANHGRKPCSHARRHAKRDIIKSRAYRKKIFGFW